MEKIIDVPALPAGCGRIRRGQLDLAKSAVGFTVSAQTETEQGLAVTQTTDEQQVNTQKEFAQQSQITLAFTQKDVECKTNEVSAKSAVMKFGPGAVENPFAKANDLITDLITRTFFVC